MIDKKVVVVATGGTIAMKYDPEKDGLVPACTGEDLAAAVPGLGEVAPLEFIQFSNIASPGMTPQNMWDLHLKLEEVLARDDVAGAIVTHGTDTLEETSYFLDLLHTSPKPIVTTAAMRGAGDQASAPREGMPLVMPPAQNNAPSGGMPLLVTPPARKN